MSNVHLHSIGYFKSPENYFWKWVDNSQVIEWSIGGKTICYREDLINILTAINGGGAPPLSSILLVIAACNRSFGKEEAGMIEHLKFIDNTYNCQPAIDFLSLISQLPETLRTGNGRVHLINHIFKQPEFTRFEPIGLKAALEDFVSGQWQQELLQPGPRISQEEFQWHLGYFRNALNDTPSPDSLIQALRTGITELPDQAIFELPPPAGTLLQQISQEPALSPLGRLAERLIPVLHIPLHTQGAGQYPYGGISDITNRGSYDKLLLSELAHDDLTLTARLVNGEALYYRREVPPDKPTSRRILLIDATLKMWGIPRLFAMAAALALINNLKKKEKTASYMLEGKEYRAINLEELKGVRHAMGILDYTLHCGNAIQQFLRDQPFTDDDELVLITDAQSFHNPSFMAAYSMAKLHIRYIITVSRNGETTFKEISNGRSKTLGTAKLDLEDILKVPSKVNRELGGVDFKVPVFYSQRPYPLLLPLASSLKRFLIANPVAQSWYLSIITIRYYTSLSREKQPWSCPMILQEGNTAPLSWTILQ